MSGRPTSHSHLALRRFHLRVVFAVSTVAVLTVSTSAASVWLAERHSPRSDIKDFWTAAWWAMETVTTVGYGDHHPTTTTGRFIAVGLMVVGVALVGVITATVVTWFFSELAVIRERLDRLDVPGSTSAEVPEQLPR